MTKNPLISIITVNLNNLEGLKKTMNSVFEQTYQEFEYIIIDGGSTDGSKEYIEKHSEKIDYWVSEPDKGIYNGMNKGIKVAKGEYFLFLNSGDHLFDEEVLEKNYGFLKGYDIVYFDLKVIGEKETYIKKFPERLSFSFFVNNVLPHQATFINAELFNKVGEYDESIKIASDWKFFIDSIGKYNASYLKINKTLAVFNLDGLSSIPENWQVISKERQKVLESSYGIFVEDYNELSKLKTLISNLRKSRKIRLLVKLGLLRDF